jgi:hypothetical protein
MNSRIIAIFMVFYSCLQSCGRSQESESERDIRRKQENFQAYKKRYMFDAKSEKSACDKAGEIASQEYQIIVERCSWNGSLMELSLSKGDYKYVKTLRVKPDNNQDYHLATGIYDNDVVKFLVAMTQAIRHSAANSKTF